ncbi:uridine diphosphate glucose pyrophosphatase NUDT14-like [Macrobrachium nipponense]|uniref:uridine diphosphate glucose pyrophosphatase NUDT14-like n=1 Tax=Macrobrachium nipponense TaxID=159736 RepID=UPI0030C7C529
MDKIEDVSVEPLTESKFFIPYRMHYKQDGKKKVWDLVTQHESVSIIIYNTDKKALVFVRQFRPAVYYSIVRHKEPDCKVVDTSKFPGVDGITLELCAGIHDKDQSLVQDAKHEVLEECGYDVPLEKFQKILTLRSGVGVTGDLQTMFYVEVTNEMKKSQGGGLEAEGELIDVVEMSIPEVRALISQDTVNCPGGFLFAVMWFLHNKAPKD